MDMNAVYRETGSYRATAEICGTTHRTVKRSVLAALGAEEGGAPTAPHNYDEVKDLVAERVERSKGRISAKRLLAVVQAAGYSGSARNLRRLVAETKAEWKQQNHRGRRPGIWTPGDMVVFDWGEIGPLFVFCAVVAWSRVRFVYFADNLGAESTMTALARCFEYLGVVPKTALTDRMGCLKGATVAGLVVPTPTYVRFATHYGFVPDFCEGADPESKGLVENLVGYVKSDLIIVNADRKPMRAPVENRSTVMV
jgi:transposase